MGLKKYNHIPDIYACENLSVDILFLHHRQLSAAFPYIRAAFTIKLPFLIQNCVSLDIRNSIRHFTQPANIQPSSPENGLSFSGYQTSLH
jgi:hypothetical protein